MINTEKAESKPVKLKSLSCDFTVLCFWFNLSFVYCLVHKVREKVTLYIIFFIHSASAQSTLTYILTFIWLKPHSLCFLFSLIITCQSICWQPPCSLYSVCRESDTDSGVGVHSHSLRWKWRIYSPPVSTRSLLQKGLISVFCRMTRFRSKFSWYLHLRPPSSQKSLCRMMHVQSRTL